jgi:hypothetical protein
MLLDNQIHKGIRAVKSSKLLSLKNSTFVVPLMGWHHYYNVEIDVERSSEHLLRFSKRPPVLVDGYVIFDKHVYQVSVQDIHRGVIRKSKQVTLRRTRDANGIPYTHLVNRNDPSRTNPISGNADGRDAAEGSKGSRGSASSGVRQDSDQRRLSHDPGLEDDAVIDATWQEQVGSLLHSLSEEEGGEWEIEDPTQSGLALASGSV